MKGDMQESTRTIVQKTIHKQVAGVVILFSGLIAGFGQQSNN